MKLSMQAKVGLVSLLALFILVGMVVWKGDIFLVARGYELVGSFNNAGGLMPGAEVRYRGYSVGKVTRIEPNPSSVNVYLLLQSNTKVPDDSTLRVAFDGLIGQKFVEIIPGISEKMATNKSVLIGFSTLGIVDFIDIGTQNLEESKRILQSVRNITDDPVVQKAAKNTLVNIEKATLEINRITSELSKALSKGGFEETIKSLTKASDTITSVSKRLDSIISALDKLVNDPTFTSNLKDTVSNAKDAFEEFKKASSDADKVLKRYAK
jgi:phospholipid/cholesterol/gamma-HCH transport system substrate-binding protein